MDRTRACGACDVGSIPTEGTRLFILIYPSKNSLKQAVFCYPHFTSWQILQICYTLIINKGWLMWFRESAPNAGISLNDKKDAVASISNGFWDIQYLLKQGPEMGGSKRDLRSRKGVKHEASLSTAVSLAEASTANSTKRPPHSLRTH